MYYIALARYIFNIYLLPFRYAITKAFVVAFVMTLFSVFDVPVFWPILLCYWIEIYFIILANLGLGKVPPNSFSLCNIYRIDTF